MVNYSYLPVIGKTYLMAVICVGGFKLLSQWVIPTPYRHSRIPIKERHLNTLEVETVARPTLFLLDGNIFAVKELSPRLFESLSGDADFSAGQETDGQCRMTFFIDERSHHSKQPKCRL